jgi:hypothetical protein
MHASKRRRQEKEAISVLFSVTEAVAQNIPCGKLDYPRQMKLGP